MKFRHKYVVCTGAPPTSRGYEPNAAVACLAQIYERSDIAMARNERKGMAAAPPEVKKEDAMQM